MKQFNLPNFPAEVEATRVRNNIAVHIFIHLIVSGCYSVANVQKTDDLTDQLPGQNIPVTFSLPSSARLPSPESSPHQLQVFSIFPFFVFLFHTSSDVDGK